MGVLFAPVRFTPNVGAWGHGRLEDGSAPVAGDISSPFGVWEQWRRDAGLGPHNGIDLAVVTGTPIEAPAPGVVAGIRPWDGLPFRDAQGAILTKGGNTIWLDHGHGVHTYYGHLDSFTAGLKVGDGVQAGEVIGLSGNTGKSTGPHLHWGCYRVNANGTVAMLDPLSLSQEREPLRFLDRARWLYHFTKGTAHAYATDDPSVVTLELR